MACIIQLIHDTELDYLNNYHIYDAGIWIFKSSVFFTFGVVFTMGVVFSQFLPRKGILKIIHVIMFSSGFILFEYLTLKNSMLDHVNFSLLISLSDDLMVLATLAWIKSYVLSIYGCKEGKYKRC